MSKVLRKAPHGRVTFSRMLWRREGRLLLNDVSMLSLIDVPTSVCGKFPKHSPVISPCAEGNSTAVVLF